jgi:hypothetical protein
MLSVYQLGICAGSSKEDKAYIGYLESALDRQRLKTRAQHQEGNKLFVSLRSSEVQLQEALLELSLATKRVAKAEKKLYFQVEEELRREVRAEQFRLATK